MAGTRHHADFTLAEFSLRGSLVHFGVCGCADSLVKGSMDIPQGDWLIQAILCLEVGQQSSGWYARVPIASDPVDDPSRLDFEALQTGARFKRVGPRQPISFHGGIGR